MMQNMLDSITKFMDFSEKPVSMADKADITVAHAWKKTGEYMFNALATYEQQNGKAETSRQQQLPLGDQEPD